MEQRAPPHTTFKYDLLSIREGGAMRPAGHSVFEWLWIFGNMWHAISLSSQDLKFQMVAPSRHTCKAIAWPIWRLCGQKKIVRQVLFTHTVLQRGTSKMPLVPESLLYIPSAPTGPNHAHTLDLCSHMHHACVAFTSSQLHRWRKALRSAQRRTRPKASTDA